MTTVKPTHAVAADAGKGDAPVICAGGGRFMRDMVSPVDWILLEHGYSASTAASADGTTRRESVVSDLKENKTPRGTLVVQQAQQLQQEPKLDAQTQQPQHRRPSSKTGSSSAKRRANRDAVKATAAVRKSREKSAAQKALADQRLRQLRSENRSLVSFIRALAPSLKVQRFHRAAYPQEIQSKAHGPRVRRGAAATEEERRARTRAGNRMSTSRNAQRKKWDAQQDQKETIFLQLQNVCLARASAELKRAMVAGRNDPLSVLCAVADVQMILQPELEPRPGSMVAAAAAASAVPSATSSDSGDSDARSDQ